MDLCGLRRNTSRLSLHDLEKLAGDQYILCRQDLDQLGYVRELLGILDRQRLLVRKLVEASLRKQSDYTKLKRTVMLIWRPRRAAPRFSRSVPATMDSL